MFHFFVQEICSKIYIPAHPYKEIKYAIISGSVNPNKGTRLVIISCGRDIAKYLMAINTFACGFAVSIAVMCIISMKARIAAIYAPTIGISKSFRLLLTLDTRG